LILPRRDVLKKFLDEIDGQLAGARPVQATIIPTALLKAEVQEVIEGKPHLPLPGRGSGQPGQRGSRENSFK